MYRRVREPYQDAEADEDRETTEEKVDDLVRCDVLSIVEGDTVRDEATKNLGETCERSEVACNQGRDEQTILPKTSVIANTHEGERTHHHVEPRDASALNTLSVQTQLGPENQLTCSSFL